MQELGDLTAFLIDPNSSMRGSLHNMLNQCGIEKVDHAPSSAVAIRTLRERQYDLILCEYSLGEGQDGQQLLEDLRNNKIIPLTTVFVMVTAERAYERIVSAAELAPNDYILKPLSADLLLERILRVLEKRAALLSAHRLVERGNLREAVETCVNNEEKYRRYAADFMRLRAELHIMLGEAVEAEQIYQKIIDTKPIGWAQLGLAKSQFMQARYDEAEQLLTTLLAENNKFMDAYDWLAKTQEASGKLAEAKEVLANAVSVSPHAVRRLRKLGEVAYETGDVETAEKSFQKVVTKAKYSEFRSPEDHVRLVKTLVKKGDTQQASTVIRDMEKSLGTMKNTPACRALSSALVYAHTGDTARATKALSEAVEACRDTVGLSNDMKMELAKNCLEHKLDAGASEVMLDVMNNATNDAALAKAMSIFEAAGHKDLGEQLVNQSRQHVSQLVTSGAEKAKQGDYQGAVQLMNEAVRKLPDNPQVVFNAALAILRYLENVGWDASLGKQARNHIDTMRRLDPANEKLAPLSGLHQRILKKYADPI